MSYLKNIFIGIDQLGNAIAGGNPDNTISGRIGFFANHSITLTLWYWKIMQFIVDYTFYPMDGFNHCHDSYHRDMCEEYKPTKLVVFFFLLSLITITSCLILIIPFYLLWSIGVIKQKNK